MAVATTSPSRPLVQRRRLLTWVLFAVPVVVFFIGAWHYRWMSDDGFINLRVVREIQAGHGPVFNAGERVEASTSPLWVAVLTLADWALPFRLEWIAVFLGIYMTIAGIIFVLRGAVRFIPTRSAAAITIPTGIWILVAFAPSWKFASSGLENGLFALWFGASFFVLARWADEGGPVPPWWVAVLVGLGPLIRPDLALISGALGLAVLVLAPDTRARVRFLAAALALPVAYEIFRMGYYDALVPNTALAKEASRSWWSQGWDYVWSAGTAYWIWVPLVAIVVGGYVPLVRAYRAGHDRRRLAIVLACAIGGALHIVYVARVGGDFMHARMVLPGLTAIVAPVAVTQLERSWTKLVMPAVVLVWAVVCIAFLRSADDAPVAFIGTPRNAVTLENYGWQAGGPNRAWLKGPGVYWGNLPVDAPARAGLPPVVVASFGVGIGSYALPTDAYVLDMLGLGDAFTSHLELHHRGVIAHEKPLPIPWVAARVLAPGAAVDQSDFPLPPFFIARPLDRPTGSFPERVENARLALGCGEIADLLARTGRPLTAGRFVSNLWHSVGDTRARIPAEPVDAVAKYCRR